MYESLREDLRVPVFLVAGSPVFVSRCFLFTRFVSSLVTPTGPGASGPPWSGRQVPGPGRFVLHESSRVTSLESEPLVETRFVSLYEVFYNFPVLVF